MQKIQNFIAKVIVIIVWLFTYIFPVNKYKVTFISYFSNDLRGDFKLISQELKRRGEYKQVFLLKKFSNKPIDKLMYLFNFILQTYHFNTSKVILIDGNNFVISNCKKKSKTKVIQMWHACGAIKKFGYDFNRKFKIKNYDYIIATGEASIDSYSRAFNVEPDKILPVGIAKTDKLFNIEKLEHYRERMFKEYPQLIGKKIVLYAPTFRGDGAFHTEFVDINLEKIQKGLGQDYILIYKLHPFLTLTNLGNNDKIINVNNKDIYMAFSVADILISDYSAVIFDFSILERPMVFYTPDLHTYEKERGFYFDYEKFIPGPICYNEEQIVDAIKNKKFDLKKVKQMKERFFDYKDGLSTIRTVNHIEKLIHEDLNFEERIKINSNIQKNL